jgi:hypothetical protein
MRRLSVGSRNPVKVTTPVDRAVRDLAEIAGDLDNTASTRKAAAAAELAQRRAARDARQAEREASRSSAQTVLRAGGRYEWDGSKYVLVGPAPKAAPAKKTRKKAAKKAAKKASAGRAAVESALAAVEKRTGLRSARVGRGELYGDPEMIREVQKRLAAKKAAKTTPKPKASKKAAKKPSKKPSKSTQIVTAAEILGGVVGTAKAPGKTARRSGRKPAKIWVCGGPVRTGCGGGKKGGHVMGHLR